MFRKIGDMCMDVSIRSLKHQGRRMLPDSSCVCVEGASPLECMMNCTFILNCPGENVMQDFVVVKSGANKYTVKKLADTEVDEITTKSFDPDDQELPSKSQMFVETKKYLKGCEDLAELSTKTVRKHLEKHFDVSLKTREREDQKEVITEVLRK